MADNTFRGITSCLRTRILASLLVSVGLVASAATAQEWPRDIEAPNALITIYQPQLESFAGDSLAARAAVSVTPVDSTSPVFGAIWIEARIETDREAREVTFVDLEVTNLRFPNATEEQERRLAEVVRQAVLGWDLTLSLDKLLASLEVIELEQQSAEEYDMTPPQIMVATEPTALLLIDGEAILSSPDSAGLMRVVNTPHFIVLDSETKMYYFTDGKIWFGARGLTEGWRKVSEPPSAVTDATKELAAAPAEADPIEAGELRHVLIATEPAELIQLDGNAEYSPIESTDLLYASNTESDLFLDIATQVHYVLIAGRWFSSTSMTGDWSFVRSDSLPPAFGSIPPESAKGSVLASVLGTVEAREAALDTYIPQTATVDRESAAVDVEYDGQPAFEAIDGTEMQYATNTASSVIVVDNSYYCCDNAIWFVASAPTGPWAVCSVVPDMIYTIPPACPVYHVRYVRVYSYTPQVVYVGYTPGYVGCYVHGGTVIYGTGYVYPTWHGSVYYPRPATYGFAVRYNPYTGSWAFGVTRSTPHFRMTMVWGGGGGSWGPAHHHGNRNVYVDRSTNININTNRETNIYNRHASGAVKRDDQRRDTDRRPAKKPERGASKPNNVFADRDGNVYRKAGSDWQKRDSRGWSSSGSSRGSIQSRSSSNQRVQNLQKHDRSRTRGAARTQSYRQSGQRSVKSGRGGRGR